jgi:hypothetical protein
MDYDTKPGIYRRFGGIILEEGESRRLNNNSRE